MRKRERENPCGVCGHYHKYEEGEVCGICGHRVPATSEKTSLQFAAFPSEILPEFLYLGSYDNASRSELLKTQGISRVLNTVPDCQNLYKNSFTYHCLQYDKTLPFDDAVEFLEQCERDKVRVLVHCMSGKNRSPAIVIAFLMKCKGWRLAQSYQWVKERRPSVDLTERKAQKGQYLLEVGLSRYKWYQSQTPSGVPATTLGPQGGWIMRSHIGWRDERSIPYKAIYQQLQEYEQKVFGSSQNTLPVFPPVGLPSFGFNFPKTSDPVPTTPFNTIAATSIFTRPTVDVPSHEFTFGAGQTQNSFAANPQINQQPHPNG